MYKNLVFTALVVMMAMSLQGNGQSKTNVVNYLGIPGPLSVHQNAFQLVWSSHPDPSLFKHEYLVAGDAFPNYKSMITIDFVVSDQTVDQSVSRKIHELEQLKKSNPDVNFEVISNPATGEKIVDCLIGQKGANEQSDIIERDVYRFRSARAKSGQQGIILFAVSDRKYGKDIKPFLTKLKTSKQILVNEVAKFSMPEINIPARY
jgi:hypothetical protein